MGLAFALSLAGVLIAPQLAGAATRTWASGTGNWNDAASWSGSVVPVAGDDAAISGGTVTLTNTTPWLGSFTNSGTLIFSGNDGFGTNVALTATNVTLLAGGRITHATNTTASTNAAGVWVPSNRVWIVCSNFYLATNGAVDTDFKGYRGATNTGFGFGPGAGGGDADTPPNFFRRGGGGGYGGKGGDTDKGSGRQFSGGVAYGSSNAPVDPGSGGGAYDSNGGGAAGGAVRIEASGMATILGTITANGSNAVSWNGGGSAGSIWISCDTFAGSTNGLLRARGGNSGPNVGTGGGGGGRIAVTYGAAQTANPGVRFDTSNGTATSPGYPGEIGTVHFPHAGILQQPLAAGRLDQWLFNNVRLFIPGFTTWASPSLTVSNCVVTFGEPGFALNVPDTLTIAGSGSLAGLESGTHQLTCTNLVIGSSGTFALGTNWAVTCTNVTVSGAGALTVGPAAALSCSNVTVSSGGTMTIGTNSALAWGSLRDLTIDNASFTLGSNSTVVGGFSGNVTARNGGSISLGLQSAALSCGQITVTNGGNLSLYLTSLDCTNILAYGTGPRDTSNIRLYYLSRADCTTIVLTNGGTLAVWAGATNWGGKTYATVVTAGRDVTIGPNSWLYPWPFTQATDTGRTALLSVQTLNIAVGGGIDADSKGYLGYAGHSGWGPGKGLESSIPRGGGGGHGGKGGDCWGAGEQGGSTNDSPTLPVDMGSSGSGVQAIYGGGSGGGAVRIQAGGNVTVDGIITANGGDAGSFAGGGAGGTINLYCRRFAGAASGILRAKGGAGFSDGGGGGGGRIAVWRQYQLYAGTPTVTDNGTSVTNGAGSGTQGMPGDMGTVYWGDVIPAGSIFVVH